MYCGVVGLYVGIDEGRLLMCACKRTNTLFFVGMIFGMSGFGLNGLKNVNFVLYGLFFVDKVCDKNSILFLLIVAGLIVSICVAVI